MLHLYRICRNIYDPKDYTGASRTPGRWHTIAQSVLYFSSSLALCVLELKANSVSFTAIREEFHYIELAINPDRLSIEEVPESFYSGNPSRREKNWTSDKELTSDFGSEWYRNNNTLILKVRSAVLPTDSNFILNTAHPDFSKLKFPKPLKIPLDPRVY